MSWVLPLPFAKVARGIEVPSLRETLLRLAATVRINFVDTLGLPTSELGSVESWVDEVRRFGLLDYDGTIRSTLRRINPQWNLRKL